MAYSEEQKEEIFDEIFKRLTKGEALRTVLQEKHMPDSNTFYIWIEADKSKSEQYTHACNQRADKIFEECIAIADDQEDDIIELADGKEITNHNVINRARLRVDTRKWMLGKLNPKKYGDRVQNDVTIEDKLSDEARERRIQELKEKMNGPD